MSPRDILKLLVPPILIKVRDRLMPPKPQFLLREESVVGGYDYWKGREWLGFSRDKLRQVRESVGVPAGSRAYFDLIAVVAGLAARAGSCRVLDFGGGTGFIYFQLQASGLLDGSNIQWIVVDNPSLAEIAGEEMKASTWMADSGKGLDFRSNLDGLSGHFDVLLINTTAQYFDDLGFLEQLLSLQPDCVVLTRFLSAPQETIHSSQLMTSGDVVPCTFFSRQDLCVLMGSRGYKTIFDQPNYEESDIVRRKTNEKLRARLDSFPSRDYVFGKQLDVPSGGGAPDA